MQAIIESSRRLLLWNEWKPPLPWAHHVSEVVPFVGKKTRAVDVKRCNIQNLRRPGDGGTRTKTSYMGWLQATRHKSIK